MRPVLVELPSKFLFAVALVWAVVALVLDIAQRRRDPKSPRSSTPLLLAALAVGLMGFRGGGWIPTGELFGRPWLPVPIHSYGVMLGISMIVGWFLVMKLARQDGIPTERAGNIYMWTAVWSIVGARLLYSIVQYEEYDSFLDVFKIWEGGLVAYGGMIGGFFASWYNCRRAQIPLLRWADVAAPSVVLGTAITRIGCLLFGCDYGKRTDLAWAIQFPRGSPAFKDHVNNFQLPADALQSFPIHPTQVYETLAGLFIFAVLLLVRRLRRFSGIVFVAWVVGYGILRPIIEVFRDDDQRGNVGPLSTSQFIGIVSATLALGLLVYLYRRYRENPQAMRLWEQPLPAAAPAPVPAEHRRPGSGGKRRRRTT
jgi:phosphatidylglycerol---prolipoprotein diacylglyceryl transferase